MNRATLHEARAEPVETVAFVSLGCPKNLIDSEKMLGLLAEDGLLVVGDEGEADALVVNTCGFLEASRVESLEVLREAAERKRAGLLQRLVVAGCLVQRHRARLLEWCPEIDALIGVFDRDRVVEAVRGGRPVPGEPGGPVPAYSSIAASDRIARRARGIEADGYHESDAARLRLTPRHYAYLRISEGCNQNCAFCTIPSIRGRMRSKPLAALRAEATELLRDGAFELNLIGQDTTSYGLDIGEPAGLTGMLQELDRLVGEEAGSGWVRLMYAYPSCFTDGMIDAIAGLPHVVKYIDMPLQHISDRVLELMRRRTSRRLIETLLGKLRDRMPHMAIRTTFISGYPTETETEHRELVRFVRDFGFEHVGVFCYSPEPGTPAGTLHDAGHAVPAEVAEERREELMLAQQEVVFARHRERAEARQPVDVLIEAEADVDGEEPDGARWYTGRTDRQAPEIDGVICVRSLERRAPGERIRCRVVGWHEYDLVARPESELTGGPALPILPS